MNLNRFLCVHVLYSVFYMPSGLKFGAILQHLSVCPHTTCSIRKRYMFGPTGSTFNFELKSVLPNGVCTKKKVNVQMLFEDLFLPKSILA